MKHKLLIICTLLLIVALTESCKKKESSASTAPTPTPVTPTNTAIPTVLTTNITNITDSSATTGGTVTSEGNDVILQVGICWDEQPNPTLLKSKTTDGAGVGSYASKLNGLKPNTTYYVRAYATNASGTAYGSEISFKTTKPQQWTKWTTGIINLNSGSYFTDIVANGSDLIISGVKTGFFKGSGTISSWTSIGNMNNKTITSLVNKNSDLFAAIPSSGVFYSSDGGASWTAKNNGIGNLDVGVIDLMENNLFVMDTTNGAIYKSTDNAGTWTTLTLPQNPSFPSAITHNGNSIFVVDNYYQKIYVSTDGGSSWGVKSGPTSIIKKILSVGTNLYACTQNGLYLSTDNGNNWSKPGPTSSPLYSIASDNGTLYVGGTGNVYTSTDNGAQWKTLGIGLPYEKIVALKVVSGSVFASGIGYAVSIYKLDL